jgi:hypothetical protein
MAANSWKQQAALLRPPCPHRGSPTYLELYTHWRAMRACLWLADFQRDEQRRGSSVQCRAARRSAGVRA